MTPDQIAEVRDMEQRLAEAENELTNALHNENTTVDDLRADVLLVRLVRATLDALLRPDWGGQSIEDIAGGGASNVIPFPSHRRLH